MRLLVQLLQDAAPAVRRERPGGGKPRTAVLSPAGAFAVCEQLCPKPGNMDRGQRPPPQPGRCLLRASGISGGSLNFSEPATIVAGGRSCYRDRCCNSTWNLIRRAPKLPGTSPLHPGSIKRRCPARTEIRLPLGVGVPEVGMTDARLRVFEIDVELKGTLASHLSVEVMSVASPHPLHSLPRSPRPGSGFDAVQHQRYGCDCGFRVGRVGGALRRGPRDGTCRSPRAGGCGARSEGWRPNGRILLPTSPYPPHRLIVEPQGTSLIACTFVNPTRGGARCGLTQTPASAAAP